MSTTIFSFQTQLVSIMDALSKTAVLEISKLVEIESKMLKIEITRGRNEIASLTEKLQLMENLLWIAQGRRQQDAVGRPATPGGARDGSGSGCGRLEPHGTRPAIKSESQWENICSSTETSSVHRGEERPAVELTNTAIEQPELIVVKEEPSEADAERNRPCEKRSEADTQTRSSDVTRHHPKAVSDQQQPTFTECFVTPSSQPCGAGPQRQEPDWNLPACTNLDAGKSLGQHVTPQSASMAKNMKMHHSLRNSAAKRFSCLQCGKSFRCFSQLEIHQRSHTGEKPFRCTLCGKRYAQKGHLYTHQRTHTGEKPYRCPICGKGFIQKCTLDMHQRTHTGEKPFICIKCGKGFTKNCNLKKHLAVHIDPSVHMYGSESRAPIFSGTTIHGTTSNIAVGQM